MAILLCFFMATICVINEVRAWTPLILKIYGLMAGYSERRRSDSRRSMRSAVDEDSCKPSPLFLQISIVSTRLYISSLKLPPILVIVLALFVGRHQFLFPSFPSILTMVQ